MIHTLELGVQSPEALDFWADRLAGAGRAAKRTHDGRTLVFADPDGLRLELGVAAAGNPPLRAVHPEIPAEHAIVGLEGARAYAYGSEKDRLLTDVLGFTPAGDRDGEYRLDGDVRHFRWAYDEPPQERGRPGAGTVHHIAWASPDADQVEWQRRLAHAGAPVTDVIDRDYFKSIYFREPRAILFEIATLSPGFAVDEDPDRLGESLRLPDQHEHRRPALERVLRPVVNPRTALRDPVAP